jgi:hypothetical protein
MKSFSSALFILLISILISRVITTLVVDDGTSQMTYRAPYIYWGLTSFNITAELVVLNEYDSCQSIATDLTGKIAISPSYADCPGSETELGLGIRSQNILNANAEGIIFILKNDEVERSFASANVGFLRLDVAILLISFNDGQSINETVLTNNSTAVYGTITSNDIPVLDVGRTPWHIVLMTIGLACDVLAFIWTSFQLKYHYNSASAHISRTALILLIIGCFALICERTLTFVYIFGPTFYLDLLTGFMAMGIILVTFASTFIALYWNTLLFPHKKRTLESSKIFVPLLCFFSALAVIYMVFEGQGMLASITILQGMCVGILGILALYFVISGFLLFRTMKTYFTAAVNKKQVVERLRVSLVLAGISMLCLLVAVLLASPAPYLANQAYYWLIRVFINLFGALSAAALAFLFRTKASKHPHSSKATSSQNYSKSTGTSGN